MEATWNITRRKEPLISMEYHEWISYFRTVFYKQWQNVGSSTQNTDIRSLICHRTRQWIYKGLSDGVHIEYEEQKSHRLWQVSSWVLEDILHSKRVGIRTSTNIFHKIKNGKVLPLGRKTAVIYNGQGNREPTEVFCFYRYVEQYFQESWLVG